MYLCYLAKIPVFTRQYMYLSPGLSVASKTLFLYKILSKEVLKSIDNDTASNASSVVSHCMMGTYLSLSLYIKELYSAVYIVFLGFHSILM